MSEPQSPEPISKKPVVYAMPGESAVTRRCDIAFGPPGDDGLTLDVYSPPDSVDGEIHPAVVIVAGYPDPGFQRIVGCKFKDMGSSVSWARLIAASGLVAITYSNRNPGDDVHELLRRLRTHGGSLGVDARRIGLWASSGNVPLALSLLMATEETPLNCAALCYGYTMDLEASTGVADAARTFGFANPCAGMSVERLRRDVPLFLARAGSDEMPRLNETLDRFVLEALGRDLPLTLVNLPSAPHAFDLFHDTADSRAAIRQILAFLRFHLGL